ncbi:hypothetical protein [Streptomyces sp. NPDC007070]|uniref:hypothetical protein n=1 Tax=Streptomyces sp. NPDC007070 TaxID=3154312 RepID=UPI0033F961EA
MQTGHLTGASRPIVLLGILAGLVLSGCSADEPGREFAVPKVVCEVPVPADALSALLPASGRRIAVPEYAFNMAGEGLCKVSVDDQAVLMVDRERIDAGHSAYVVLRGRTNEWTQKSAEGGSMAYIDRAAVSLVKCRGTGVNTEDVSIFIQVL